MKPRTGPFLLLKLLSFLLVAIAVPASGQSFDPALIQLNSGALGGFEGQARLLISSSLFAGILLVMSLYNLFIYWHSRTLSYLYYGLYGLCIFLMAIIALGPLAAVWPHLVGVQQELTLSLGMLAALFVGLFANRLLAAQLESRWLRVGLRATGLVIIISGSLMVISWHLITIYAVVLSCFAMVLLLVAVGIKLWRGGVKFGRAYTVAWLCVAFGFACTLFQLQGWLEWPVAPRVPLMIGLIIEVTIVSFVLAGSFSEAHSQLVVAHEKAVASAERAKELQELAERTQEESTDKLERAVQERTFELEVTLRELEETNLRLEEQSTMDFLTGVKNRKHFDKRFLAEFRRSRREQTPLSVMMLDIDHFKSVNDTHGHLVGDEVIRQIAQQIQAVLKRPSDVLTRYGGEEFAVILPATPMAGAMGVAEEVVEAVRARPVLTENGPLKVTLSAGVSSSVVQATMEPEQLLAVADKALYQAKSSGRNQARFLEFSTETQPN